MDRNIGQLGPILPADDALREYSAAELPALERLRRNALVGSGAEVADRLRTLAESLQLDELVIITWASELQVRRRSYELLAQAFDLRQ